MMTNGSLLRDVPAEDRPRERLLRGGGGALSDAELIAVFLRTGKPGQSAVDMAREILAEHGGGVVGLLDADKSSLVRFGLGSAKAATVLAAVELGRRLAHQSLPQENPLDSPHDVARYLHMRYGGRGQEIMGALFLDVRNRVVAEAETFRGTLTRAAVEPRAILTEALQRRATSIILFHTHPSGDPSPSAEDLQFTDRLRKGGDLLGIRLLDHVILGDAGRWVSLQRRGAW
ncbi:MAG: DNA repair protein RadC [Acidobacteriota bacterium]